MFDRPTPADAALPGLRAAEGAPRVVIAEDDVEMRGLLSSMLRQDGYEVIEAEDGDALLALLRTWPGAPPAMVISDVQMPRATGLRALAWIRRTLPEVPVVLITAFGSPEVHREGARLGARAVLDKPFVLASLRAMVRGILAQTV